MLSVHANQISFRQDMTVHGLFEAFLRRGVGVYAQLRVKGIDAEVVMVGTIWRTRSHVTHIAFRIFSLLSIAGSRIAEAFRKVGRGVDVPGDPVRYASCMRGIGIMYDDGQGLRAGRYAFHVEGGTRSGAIASVFSRDLAVILKGRAADAQRGRMRCDCHDQAD